MVKFNVAHMEFDNPTVSKQENQLVTTMHEITHALGMANHLFKFY